jgi:hypothetical protein
VKFSTLQEYGVDRVFFLENDNVDSTQRNVVFLVRGEKHRAVKSVAGKQMRLIIYILSHLPGYVILLHVNMNGLLNPPDQSNSKLS